MFFIILMLLTALGIESIGTFVSVIGLSALFASDPVIIALAVALDVGKLVTVSFTYKYWKEVGITMKVYMVAACIVLMTITSAGAFGYLSGSFQKAISGTNQDTVILDATSAEQTKLQKRKEEIDAQIAKLPDNNVRGRTSLMRQFGPEVGRINKRLEEIDKQLPALKVASLKKDVEVGPIIYIAKVFNTDTEHAVVWVIFTLIFVFDPLAVASLINANFLIARRQRIKAEKAFKALEVGKVGQVLKVDPETKDVHWVNPEPVEMGWPLAEEQVVEEPKEVISAVVPKWHDEYLQKRWGDLYETQEDFELSMQNMAAEVEAIKEAEQVAAEKKLKHENILAHLTPEPAPEVVPVVETTMNEPEIIAPVVEEVIPTEQPKLEKMLDQVRESFEPRPESFNTKEFLLKPYDGDTKRFGNLNYAILPEDETKTSEDPEPIVMAEEIMKSPAWDVDMTKTMKEQQAIDVITLKQLTSKPTPTVSLSSDTSDVIPQTSLNLVSDKSDVILDADDTTLLKSLHNVYTADSPPN
jgi:hypothetical protein